MFQLWNKIVTEGLEVEEPERITVFSDVLFARQVSLYEEYKDQFKNIYRDRVAEYFKHAPKRVVNIRGELQSRTQESPSRKQHGSVPLYARKDAHQGKRQVSSRIQPNKGYEDGCMNIQMDESNTEEQNAQINQEDHFTRSPYGSDQAKDPVHDRSRNDEAMQVDESNCIQISSGIESISSICNGAGTTHDLA